MMNHKSNQNQPDSKLTGFRCEICNGLFSKSYLLKSHEQKIHSLIRPDPTKLIPPPAKLPVPYITTVVIPAIQTSAMAVAKERGEIPFAVLHMMNEVPLIVRVLEQGQYSVLKAAESNDFRESQRGVPGPEESNSVSIAVVATIFQKISAEGKHFFEICGPVSCYQTNEILQRERTFPVMQDSISNMNLHKTLTQLNSTDVSTNIAMQQCLERSADEPVASGSGTNVLKRKQASKRQYIAPFFPAKRAALKQPKVTTVAVDWASSTQPIMPQLCERNIQNMATGSLLSPERATQRQNNSMPNMDAEQEDQDPFSDIDVFDLVQMEDALSSNDDDLQDIDIASSVEDIFLPVL